ncbi:MAG: hydroxysqualene dehydroxylase HpnE [Planctomycetota bacterium]
MANGASATIATERTAGGAGASSARGPRVAVLGAGVAGMAAAVSLSRAGVAVDLIDTRRKLGGRATSFEHPATGHTLDNCQHVLMRCCTALRSLYETLGVSDRVEWHRRLNFVQPGGRRDTLEAGAMPAPGHFGWSFLGLSFLNLRDKLGIARAMLALVRTSPEAMVRADAMSFGAWLDRHAPQTERAMARYWEPVVVSAVNLPCAEASARYAIQVFREGFLSRGDAYVMGVSRVPLRALYERVEPIVAEAGGRLRLGEAVEAIAYDADAQRVTGVTVRRGRGTETIAVDAVVSALPADRLSKAIDSATVDADDRLARLDEVGVSSILGVHLAVACPSADEPAIDLPHAALLDSPLHWVFNEEPRAAADGRVVQWVHGVISASDDLLGKTNDELVELTWAEVRRCFPAAGERELVAGVAVREVRATFAAVPGVDAVRPATAGAIGNLMLAGDWVDTGWPATMEGAARSGYRAAAAALEAMGRDASAVPGVADYPVGGVFAVVSA